MHTKILISVVLLWIWSGTIMSAQDAAGPLTIQQLRAERQRLAHQPRRLIMNNDGCDVLYFPADQEVTAESFLAQRTTPLAGTHVGSLAFCPTSSGFSFFTHNTKVGTLLTRQGKEFGIQPDRRNITQDLIGQGTDCLQAVIEFAHQHQLEAFWSMRMNDTHDAAHRPEQPYFLYPPLKQQHPEWLVGEPQARTPFGRWSSVNYEIPEIRELAFGYIDEVCRGYAIDGIELDFFRHLCFFPSTAQGEVATDQQRDWMTGLMRRVRTMTEEVGLARGRPILVSVRVPDSVEYCRDMGLEIDRWLSEGLLDLLITTGYFRLNRWQYSVELGHRHNVPVYPCLSDSRVRGETRFQRASVPSSRGRAMNAWLAGADGLHLFNHFDPHAPIWSELGDPDKLLLMDKLYFVNVRDGDPRRFLAGGRAYQQTPLFGPAHPELIASDKPLTLSIAVGDDLVEVRKRGGQPQVQLHLEVPVLGTPRQLRVAWNGVVLDEPTVQDGWLDWSLDADIVKQGENLVEISLRDTELSPETWTVVYDGRRTPAAPWRRDRGSARTSEELCGESMLISDQGEQSGDYLYYRHPWGASPGGAATAEARVRVKSGSSFLIFGNGSSGERLGLWPDHIALFHHRNLRFDMDTTDQFHVYRVELRGQDVRVLVDGAVRIEAPGVLRPRSGYESNEISFGAANSPMQGAAWWAQLRARATGAQCRDAVVSISYE